MSFQILTKVLVLGLVLGPGLAWAPMLIAQDTEEALPAATDVVAEYIEAIGSEMALHGIESMKLEADFDGLSGREGKVILHFSDGMWHYDFQLSDGNHTYKYCNDGSAWQNQHSWAEMSQADTVKFQEIVPVVNSPLRWLKYDGEIETKGIEEVAGNKCYAVEFRPASGDPVTRYFDVNSKLLLRMSYITTGMSADWYLSEYKEVDGFTIPMKREQHFSGSLSYVVHTKKIVFNTQIDETLFERPEEETTEDDVSDDPFGDGS